MCQLNLLAQYRLKVVSVRVGEYYNQAYFVLNMLPTLKQPSPNAINFPCVAINMSGVEIIAADVIVTAITKLIPRPFLYMKKEKGKN
jgi:hypothetical protein